VTGLLKLFAVDIEDLAVLSAHLEGATLMVNRAVYLPLQKRFAFVAERKREKTGQAQRIGVHFEGVTKVEHKNVALDKPDHRMQLLALTFDPVESPAGYVILHCAGGERIRLEVEYIEAALSDLVDDKAEDA
jgi:Protein of unknown function (DUF2948)